MVFVMTGVLVSTCLRIALQKPGAVDRELLVDLTTRMLLAGIEPAPGAGRVTP